MALQNRRQNIETLHTKPGHEKVRSILYNLLKEEFNATDDDIVLEGHLINAKGRIDALWGQTIFEIKKDLDKEQNDAKSQIEKYIQSKERERSNEKYIGIATDGKKYLTYKIINQRLQQIDEFNLDKNKPDDFILWLESVVLITDQLEATSENLCKQIGHESPLCKGSIKEIKILWEDIKNQKEVKLKYDLWKDSIKGVYGKVQDNEEPLFIEHTYLTIISKTIAHLAFFEGKLPSGRDILNGKKFQEVSVLKVIEDDFFSWIISVQKGNELIEKIASHIKRFDFSNIRAIC